MDRRALLLGGAAFVGSAAAAGGAAFTLGSIFDIAAADGNFLITRTEGEWRSMLTNAEYYVMREAGNERSGSSPLIRESREGQFHCKGCNLALYSSDQKFDSGKGFPSFHQSLPNAIRTRADDGWFTRRTEAHCRRCGSHLGHIFYDGPSPTGERHSLNGVSLRFVPASEADMDFRGKGRRRVMRA